MLTLDYEGKFGYDDLLQIMDILRSENGCPWDKEQTHESIRKNFIEETYEVCDCIDRKDRDGLIEELGDVLLQVIFHAKIAADEGQFDHSDVTDGICRKLILRHPHIFGDVKADTADEVLKNWDAIKRVEKAQKTFTETMQAIPVCFPGLMRAQKVQHKAAKANFDFENVSQAMDKLREETNELADAKSDKTFEEYGDLLFAAVNVGRLLGFDSEEALAAATDKFIRRFSAAETKAISQGMVFDKLSPAEQNALWDEVKTEEKK